MHFGGSTKVIILTEKDSNVDNYAKNNSINRLTYSTTSWTNGDVDVEINGEQIYTFEKNLKKELNYAHKSDEGTSNTSTVVAEVTWIDKTPPQVNNISTNTKEFTNQNITITVEATDELSGLADKAYSWDEKQTWTDDNTFEISQNGTYTLYVKDKLGNIFNGKLTISNIDKEAPVINALTANTTEQTKEDILLTANATDELSGLADKAYSWDEKQTWTDDNTYKISENGTYTVYVRDQLGNTSSKSITISNKLGESAEACKISLVAESTSIVPDETIDIEIKMSDITQEDGIAGYGASISFNSDAFTFSKITGTEEWETPIYNDGNIVAAVTDGNGQTEDQTIAVLTLLVNSDLEDDNYEISLNDIEVSNGVETFSISPANLKLKVSNDDNGDSNGDNGNN
jgi:hypothetical protein